MTNHLAIPVYFKHQNACCLNMSFRIHWFSHYLLQIMTEQCPVYFLFQLASCDLICYIFVLSFNLKFLVVCFIHLVLHMDCLLMSCNVRVAHLLTFPRHKYVFQFVISQLMNLSFGNWNKWRKNLILMIF